MQLDLHGLNAARAKAQLFEQGRDLASIPAKPLGIGLVLFAVRVAADLLEERLVDVQKLGHRLEIGDHALADHAFDRQGSRPGLDRPIERHGAVVDLLEQLDGIAGTVVALEHLTAERHARDLDLASQGDFVLAGQQRNLPHLGQIHADRIVDPAGRLGLHQFLVQRLVVVLRILFLDRRLLGHVRIFFELFPFLAGLVALDVALVDQAHAHLVERTEDAFETARTHRVIGQRVVHLLVGEVSALLAFGDEHLDQLLGVLRLGLIRLGRFSCFLDFRLIHICCLLRRLPYSLRHNTDSTKAKVPTPEITTLIRSRCRFYRFNHWIHFYYGRLRPTVRRPYHYRTSSH